MSACQIVVYYNVTEVTKPVRERDKIKSSLSSAPPYEPSPRELEIVKTQLDRRENKKPAPRVKVTTAKNVAVTSTDHPDKVVGEALLMEALGTSEPDFLNGLLGQLINAGTQGRTVDENTLNFMLAIVKGVEPRDQGEALLAAQMAAVHNATMTFVRRLNHVDNIAQQDSAERAFNKLARTFAGCESRMALIAGASFIEFRQRWR